MVEILTTSGGMVGSLWLNKRFEQTVESLVGASQFHHLQKTKGFRLAVQYFDQFVKTAFRGDSDEEYFVNFPMANLEDNESKNVFSNCWMMTGCDPSYHNSFACSVTNDKQKRRQEDLRSAHIGHQETGRRASPTGDLEENRRRPYQGRRNQGNSDILPS